MALTATPRNASALLGARVRDYEAGETLELLEAAYIHTDGKAYKARANTAASAKGSGIVTSVNDPAGGTTAPAGKRVSICHDGPIGGFSGMTPGATVWLSAATAGDLTETQPTGALTWSRVMGQAYEEDVLWVMPGVSNPPSNS